MQYFNARALFFLGSFVASKLGLMLEWGSIEKGHCRLRCRWVKILTIRGAMQP